jgi:hypothetical protein
MVSYCDICGDYLFNGQHRGHIEIWCRAIRETKNAAPGSTEISVVAETEIISQATVPDMSRSAIETQNPAAVSGETKIRKRGRPKRSLA